MVEDIRVVEWVDVVEHVGEDGTKVTTTSEKYDMQVKYRGTDTWVSVPRVQKSDTA